MKRNSTLIIILSVVALAGAAAPRPPLFVTSDRCLGCHNGLVTDAGEDVSIGADWRASMMANAARDPYWQAAVRRETIEHPTAAAEIQHECAACHMPMARFQEKTAEGHQQVFVHLPQNDLPPGPGTPLALDGVSCAMCHQIGAERLGEPSSFTAGFEIDTDTPPGRRLAYGPYDVDAGRRELMRSSAQFLPEQATHVQQSELCATCHTLHTHALNDAGEVVGSFPEQVPYLEWKHSAFAGEQSCQDCHMPVVEGSVPISGVLGEPRAGVSRHVFRGGNFFMPRLLNRHRDRLGVQAASQELETTSRRTARHLESRSARLTIEHVETSAGRLRARVRIESLAGHKLPSAYPSRRAWLHLTVRDADGATLFESGRLAPDGSIAGNDNDTDPTAFEPHRNELRREDEVQIYEAILGTPDRTVTTVLLSATAYLKDNRILPRGFDKGTADDDIAVHGRALDDPDFAAGGDLVRYDVELGHTDGPFTVEAELWYQPIAYRWANNLATRESPEIDLFVSAYDAMAGSSGTVLSRDSATAD